MRPLPPEISIFQSFPAGIIFSQDDASKLLVPPVSLITGATFRGNSALSNGGALYTIGSWRPTIEDSVFEDNRYVVDVSALCHNAQLPSLHPIHSDADRVNGSPTTSLENSGGAIYVSELKVLLL